MSSRLMKALDGCAIALAVILGAGSFVAFALCPLGYWALFRLSWSEPWLLCWDAALSFTFFLQHSGMNRRCFRNWLAKRLEPRYNGALYAMASGVALTFVLVCWQASPSHLLVVRGLGMVFLGAIGVLVLAVFVWTAVSLLAFDPLGLDPIKAHMQGKPPSMPHFTVRGPYRWVRHPLYSCAIAMIWAWPEITSDRLLFCVLWTLWILVGARLEEQDLESEFGDAYRDYRRRVPMLIPWRGRTMSSHD